MKKRGTGVSVGTSSILMVFVLLCLTTFATLSLVSANADYRLVQRSAETITNYYAADALAEQVLTELTDLLKESRSAATEEDYRMRYRQGAQTMSHPIRFDGPNASFSVEAGETQRLEVVLFLPYGEDALYRKLQWRMAPTEWQSEEDGDGLNIWDGEFETAPMF